MTSDRSRFPPAVADARRRLVNLVAFLLLVVFGTLWLVHVSRAQPHEFGEAGYPVEAGHPVEASHPVDVGSSAAVGSQDRKSARPEPTNRCYLGVVIADASIDVVAETGGRIEAILVQAGDRVMQGTAVAQLESATVRHRLAIEQRGLEQAEAELASQKVEVDQAARTHQRRLALEGLLSREEAERAEAELTRAEHHLAAARAARDQAKARIAQLEGDLVKMTLRAPFTGTVARRYLEPGTMALPGTAIVRVISDAVSRVRFAVPPAHARALAIGTPVRIETEGLRGNLRAEVHHRGPEIDTASGMVLVESRLVESAVAGDAASPLPPGTVVRVSPSTPTEASPSCLGVPSNLGTRG